MASSSSTSNSQSCPQWKYDVFLSFRGEDTRKTFTSHLYQGLKNRGIYTFQDDKRLEHGDLIPEELLKAIEESQVAIVIFSKNYATSSWCLNELVKIRECKDKNGQLVIPVFYDVDPSHVRKQTESFAEAFAKHESKYKDDVEGMQKVKAWRTALTAAANLKGSDIRDGIESENIQQIVYHISSNLSKSAYSLSSLQDVVGMNAHLEKLKSLLQIEINDVRIVGIWGIGGVGKTTIAKAIFDILSYQFKATCFIADIKENAKNDQLHSLQNTLLSELLRKKDDYVNNKYDGKCMIPSRLCSMKVLIVLDDIDHSDHLEYLAGDVRWFGNGSRVIVTTRNRHLIEKNDAIYEVPTLLDHEAMQLFNQHAFRKEVPSECFMMLSLEVVNHAKGLPLALKVWGSLFHNKGLSRWERIVDKIKNTSSLDIAEKLKISYDGLEPEEQEMFLDIACFFRGYEKEEVMDILESCDVRAEYGLDVLIDKSLVFLTAHNTIEMHDLMQDMGKYIVKIQKHPGERSRLWDTEDFKQVMVDNTGTMALEAIWCTYSEKLCFSKDAMNNMKRLRLLCICDKRESYRPIFYFSNSSSSDSEDVPYEFNCHDGFIEYLPNNLRWFVWHDYPWKALPENFKPQRLVHIDLQWSSLHDLWTKRKFLPSLRWLDLSCSKRLMRTPDFTGMPSLEYLILKECTSLEEVHPSLGYCKKLIVLNLYNCQSLKRFPCVNVESLEHLNLGVCFKIENFPENLGIMKSELGIRELPSSIIHHQARLTKLNLSGMRNLVALPSSICKFKGLVKVDVACCPKLESLPEEISDLENLENLDASYTLISQPPPFIVRLNKLKYLSFAKQESEDGVFFVFPQVNEGLRSLEKLDLSYCNLIDGGLPEDIGSLSSLRDLYLRGNNFEHLPRSIAQLGALRCLNLSDCKRLTQLPEFPEQLDTIEADWSNDLICNSLFQNISSLQHDISASDSLSVRVFTSWNGGWWSPTPTPTIPSWFHHRGTGTSVSVNLPKIWYVSDKFLGFAICYSSITAHLILGICLCDDGMSSSMTKKLALSNHSSESNIHFFLVPFSGLWNTSKDYGKIPNDYGRIMLSFSGETEYGFRLLYKDEPKLEALLQIRENNDEPTVMEEDFAANSEHRHSVTNDVSCSSSKTQIVTFLIFVGTLFWRIFSNK